jgi:hypothetical protein
VHLQTSGWPYSKVSDPYRTRYTFTHLALFEMCENVPGSVLDRIRFCTRLLFPHSALDSSANTHSVLREHRHPRPSELRRLESASEISTGLNSNRRRGNPPATASPARLRPGLRTYAGGSPPLDWTRAREFGQAQPGTRCRGTSNQEGRRAGTRTGYGRSPSRSCHHGRSGTSRPSQTGP